MQRTRNFRRGAAVSALLASLALLPMIGSAAVADVEVSYVVGGEPYVPEAVKSSAPEPGFTLVLPNFIVDPSSSSGLTTLYAIRNRADAPTTVLLEYFDSKGGSARDETVTLAAREVYPVNIRNLGLQPPLRPGGMLQGTLVATVVDPGDGSILSDQVISGDYFLLDPDNDFASGSALLDSVQDLCGRWELRYFKGGAFDGGTNFTFFAPFNESARRIVPIATGNVYDEAGNFFGTVTVSSADTVSTVNTSDLPDSVLSAPAGAIEWVFSGGNSGVVAATYDALGRFSVGLPGVCADP